VLYPPLKLFLKKRKGCSSKLFTYFSEFLFFQFHFRYFLEGFLFISLGSMSEVSRIFLNSGNHVSFGISIVTLILLFLFICLVPVLFFVMKNPHENIYVKELFEGFKKNKLAQLYNFTFLIRRLLVISVIVIFRTANLMHRLTIFVVLQILALLFAMIVKSHEKKYSNIIEVINEVAYL